MGNWKGLVSHLSSSQNVEGELLESMSRSMASLELGGRAEWRRGGGLESGSVDTGEDE
jgi:hypothetical protein